MKGEIMMIAWTYFYNPFVMGGSTWQPEGCELEKTERIDLGAGFFGYKYVSPKGKTIIVEEKSGAIIGNSVEEVKNDIANSVIKVMTKQVEDACQTVKTVKVISQEKFWEVYDKTK
jgi:hypothetical protein